MAGNDPKEQAKKSYAKIMDYKKVFGSKEGKRVLYDLMSHFGVMDASYGDAQFIQFNEGKRFAVLFIMKKLRLDVSALLTFIEEGERE
jgi:hypothetical protein